MERNRPLPPGPGLIDQTSPRALFAELVAGALGDTGVQPSPMAVAYLVEMLDERVLAPDEAARASDPGTLAEALLEARLESGPARIRRLRDLGDRTLFVSGFFGDSLRRQVVDLGYYGEAGRCAYGELAASLASQVDEKTWPLLFEELADRFRDFADVLAEVSDRSNSSQPTDLLRLYERYLETGSQREWRRLVRRGHVPCQVSGLRRWQ